MRNIRKRILAVAMTAVLALGSISYPGTADVVQATGSGNIILTDESQLGDYNDDLAYKRVGVHDPSIIQDPDTKTYYLFGSHCAWAKSDDLKNWVTFSNNITEASAVTIFKDEIAWCKKANSNYTVAGNMWAPDVVWSEPMQKWCMYMSINGPDWNSTISLLTADKLDGDWTYVGPVIQSGMSKGYGVTFDFTKVTDESSVPARYTGNVSDGGNPTLEAHAIDACVVYDDDGNLWMTYGSWSGGISMIKLDPKTGLRDYDTTYKDTGNKVGEDGLISDPYTGYKIAGGKAVSGEGSYIQKIGKYYFLFLSYGGFAPEGGYNMRIFRSEDIKGPYLDVKGNDARTVVNGKAGTTTGTTGMRLISYYKWNFADYGYTAQGHNSATVDPVSGKAFVIYHNKYNDGTAAHEVRNHQLLLNEDGWIMAAPFEYAGETMSPKGYSQGLFTGDYGIMFQRPNVDAAKLECATEQNIRLEAGTEVKDADGKVTGYTGKISGAYEGTWTSTADTPYVSLEIGNVTYKGVFCDGTIDETNVAVMTFTAIGDTNQECLWGYKVKDPTQAIRMTIEKQIQLPDTVVTDLQLPTTGVGGSKITWKSNSVAISDDGKVFYLKEDVTAGMTATVSCNGYQYSKDYTFTVVGSDTLSEQTEIPLKTFYKDKELDMAALKQGQCPTFVNPYHYTTEDISKGVVISFDVTRTAASDRLSNIISFNNKLGKLYFTGGSYLGYNDFNDHYFDANLNAGYAAGTDYLETGKKITIKLEITSKGVTVYKNGEEVYSTATLKAGSTPGGYSANNPETTVLSWIKTAPELNFGSGNFWNDLIFKGKISNVVCSYIQPVIEVNGSSSSSSLSGIYTQDYERVTDVSAEWTSPNAPEQLTLGEDSEHGKFFLFMTPTVAANRSAQNLFGTNVEWPDNYQIEFDLGLKSGNTANRSESQFAIVSDTSFTANAVTPNDKCIFSLNCPQRTTNGETTTWQINGDGGTTVEIPSADTTAGGWVHVILIGNKADGKGTLTITSGDTSLYEGAVTLPTDKTPTGFYILNGRGSGLIKVDNIVLKEQGADYANLSNYNIVLDRAEQFVALQEKASCFTSETYTALTEAITTAKGIVNTSMTADDQATVDEQTAALRETIEGLQRTVYTVTVETSGSGSVSGLAKEGKYNSGDSLSLTAQPEAGYVLSSWQIGSETVGKSTSYSSTVTGDITIKVVFTAATDLTEYNKVLEEALEKVSETIYTDESLLALQNAITEARAEVSATAEQSVVDRHIEALKKAIADLVIDEEKEELVAPTVSAVTYRLNLALNAIALPDGWEWKQPDTKLNAGTKKYTAVYTKTNLEVEISVTVNKATDPSYALPEGLNGVEGTSLSAITLPEDWEWKNPSEVLARDKAEYTAIFTHSSGNYEPLEVAVPVTVSAKTDSNTGDVGNNGTDTGTGSGNGNGAADGQKASIVLNKNQVTLYTGKASKSVVVTANVTGASQNVTWSSSNTKVATVSNGTIKAVKKGTATITATANGVSATVKVTVKNPSIKVKKGKKSVSKVSVKKKKSVKLTVTVSPSKSGMSLAKISAKNKKIAKVTFKKGKLTIKGKKKGKFTLKIKSGKATKSLKVTVK